MVNYLDEAGSFNDAAHRRVEAAAAIPICRSTPTSGCRLTAPHRNLSFGHADIRLRATTMKWKTPVIIEIAVGLEINAYACAEVK